MSTEVAADRLGKAQTGQPADITHEVHDISPRPVAYGGFADLYCGVWKHGGDEVKVAIKVLRVRTLDPEGGKLRRQLRREISVWKRLCHPNIHILCGLCEGMGPVPAMVSPWYKNGDINSYIERRAGDPGLHVIKLDLFFNVLAGLRFLHDSFIVHGDIKGVRTESAQLRLSSDDGQFKVNVLISDEGVARLCDFGLSRLLAEHSQSITHTGVKGTSRWMAPELILDGETPSYASDIWASGCLLIEVWSAVPPYHTKKNDHQVVLALSQRDPPALPSTMTNFPLSMVRECCDFEPTSRPAPISLMARVTVEQTMDKVSHLVTRGRSVDSFGVDLLNAIETSLRSAESHRLVRLHGMAESDLLIGVVCIFAVWSLHTPPESRLYVDALYRWCLARLDNDFHFPASSTRFARSNGDIDEDPQDTARRSDLSKLRLFARLLAPIRSGLAVDLMSDFATVANRDPIKLEGIATSVVWYPDGDRIAVAFWAGAVQILSTTSGSILHRLDGHTARVNQVAISPDGKLLASCSDDGSVRLWDADTGNTVGEPMLDHADSVFTVAFSPDSARIASGAYDGTIRIRSIATWTDGSSAICAHASAVMSVAYSQDGSRIVSGLRNGTLQVWYVETGVCILGPMRGHTDIVCSVALSPDGRSFVSGSYDHAVRFWDTFHGDSISPHLEAPGEGFLSVAYSPDGTRVASGSGHGSVRILDVSTGVLQKPSQGHSNAVYSVAFSPDGTRLASASQDCTIRIWDATRGWTYWDV